MITGLDCTNCASKNVYIKDSRPDLKNDWVIRRRICDDCGERVKTIEVRYTKELKEFLKNN